MFEVLLRNSLLAGRLKGYPDPRIKDGVNATKDVLAKREHVRVCPGNIAWKVYETYGVPIDLIFEIAAEKGVLVDPFALNIHMEFPLWKDCVCCKWYKK